MTFYFQLQHIPWQRGLFISHWKLANFLRNVIYSMANAEFTYSHTKLRYEFGRQCLFSDRGPEIMESIPSDKSLGRNFVLRNPVHQSLQYSKKYSEHEVNTFRAEYVNAGINHVEGGWPKDINIADVEATQRYRRKIEKDDAYVHCVMHLTHDMEHYILQNNAINIYQKYFTELEPAPPVEKSSCRTINVYRDQNSVKRPISFLSWSADGGARLAATHCDLEFQMTPIEQCTHSYIWDIENPNKPQLVIIPHSPLCCLEFNPRDPNTLVGGLMNGQVAAFDIRRGSEPYELCPMHQSHCDPVRNVLHINSKTGTEFFSSSTDGQVKWWDTRKLSEPTDTMIIDPVKTIGEEPSVKRALGVSCLEYETTIPTRFMCGTEQGLVIGGNRKGKNAVERLPGRYAAHYGPVYALQRNPGFVKNFLTVGDWTARIWSEDCKESPIIWTYFHHTKLTDGAWSPLRFSLFMTTRYDGCLCCWDILRKQNAPVVTAQLCDEPLTKIRPQDQGRLVPCGSRKGAVYLVELSENLGTSAKNDKLLLTNMFERESKRERILEARMRELRLKMKVRSGQQGGPGGGQAADTGGGDQDIIEAETEYRQLLEAEAKSQQETPSTQNIDGTE